MYACLIAKIIGLAYQFCVMTAQYVGIVQTEL